MNVVNGNEDDEEWSTQRLLNSHDGRVSTSRENEPHSSFKELFQRQPLYLTVVTSIVLSGMCYASWIIFVIPNAEAKGFPSGDAVFLATIGGAANVLGRFFLGFFSSRKILEDRFTFCILHLITATVFFLNKNGQFFSHAGLSVFWKWLFIRRSDCNQRVSAPASCSI